MKTGIKFIIFVISCLAVAPIGIFMVAAIIGIKDVSFFKLIISFFIFSLAARLIYQFIFERVFRDVYDKEDVLTYVCIFHSISYVVGFIILGKIIQDIGWFRAVIQGILLALPCLMGVLPNVGGEDKSGSHKRVTSPSPISGSNRSSVESVDDLLNKTKSSFKQPNGDVVYQDANGMTIGTSSSNPDGSTSYYNRDMKFIGTSVGSKGNEKFYDSKLNYKGQSEKDVNGDTSFYDKDLEFKGKSSKNSNGTNTYHKY